MGNPTQFLETFPLDRACRILKGYMEYCRKIAVKPMPRRDDAIELVAAHMRDQGYEFITADRLRNRAARSKNS